jgi:hypothetical protein
MVSGMVTPASSPADAGSAVSRRASSKLRMKDLRGRVGDVQTRGSAEHFPIP